MHDKSFSSQKNGNGQMSASNAQAPTSVPAPAAVPQPQPEPNLMPQFSNMDIDVCIAYIPRIDKQLIQSCSLQWI